METPVLFVFFRRPETTLRVFDRIREAAPSRLYLVSDGPRRNLEGEEAIVRRLRDEILGRIDWPCEIHRRFRAENLGCHPGMEDAITWFFDNEEEGIILEDDCLPDPTFFPFCEELLARYRDCDRVMAVCGVNFRPLKGLRTSYTFSRFCNIWGWATWRRAWKKFDPTLSAWPRLRAERTLWTFCTPTGARAYTRSFDRIHAGEKNAWDAKWCFSVFSAGGLAAVPRVNLVKNIGFSGGTNTQFYDPFLNMETEPLAFPLVHPETVEPHEAADRLFARTVSPRNYRRTVRLMFRRWGLKAVPLLFRAAKNVGGQFLARLRK